jgi:hypothetical protein
MKQKYLAKLGLLAVVLVGLFAGASTASAQFVNGGFESGDFSGWTQGSGYWYYNQPDWPINAANYFPGGSKYNAAGNASAIVTQGIDSHSHLNTVFEGKYSARINDWSPGFGISAIRQTVTNYTDPHIFFAWAAVLEDSHGPTDSDNFTLLLTDDTTGTTLYSASYNSYSNGSIFKSSNYWYYTDWQIADLDVSAFAGDTFTISLLAADCSQGAHAGYVYLDGFSRQIPTTGAVPEPSTYGMIGAGALLVGALLRRRFAKR